MAKAGRGKDEEPVIPATDAAETSQTPPDLATPLEEPKADDLVLPGQPDDQPAVPDLSRPLEEPNPDELVLPDEPEPKVTEEAAATGPATLAPDPVPEVQAAPAAPEKRRSVFVPLVLGGIVAAGLGFGAAHFVAEGWPPGAQGTARQNQQEEMLALLQGQAARLAALEEQLEAAAPDLSGVEAGQSALMDQLAALEQRFADFEARPQETADVSAIEADLTELRSLVEEAQFDPTALRAEAEEMAAAARAEAEAQAEAQAEEAAARASAAARQAAITEVTSALEAGQEFGPALDTLQGEGIAVPTALRDASGGVPTLDALQRSFPPAARAALADALPAVAGDDPLDRLGNFFRSQTGMRSLAPQAGNDPDAILSRAEANLSRGDLSATLEELRTLPPAGLARMQDWMRQAETRLEAQNAAAELSAANSN